MKRSDPKGRSAEPFAVVPDARQGRVVAALSDSLLPELVRLLLAYDVVDAQRWRKPWPNDAGAVVININEAKNGRTFGVQAGRLGWFGAVGDRFGVGRHKWSVQLPTHACAIVGISLQDADTGSLSEAMASVAYVSIHDSGGIALQTGSRLSECVCRLPAAGAFHEVWPLAIYNDRGDASPFYKVDFEVDVDGGRLFATIGGLRCSEPIISGLCGLGNFAPFAAIGCCDDLLSLYVQYGGQCGGGEIPHGGQCGGGEQRVEGVVRPSREPLFVRISS